MLGVAFATLGLTACGSGGSASPAFTADRDLSPAFGWGKTDYTVRCQGRPVTFDVTAGEGGEAKVGGKPAQSGEFKVSQSLRQGQSVAVTFTGGDGESRTFHVRCLPSDFPEFRLEGTGPVSGFRLVMVQMNNGYAALFDRYGTPVWWYRMKGEPVDAKLLPDSTVAYAPVVDLVSDHFDIRSLTGRLIRRVSAVGKVNTDSHDIQLLANGNYMLGAHRYVYGVDTSRFGGEANASLNTTQVQEIRPDGSLAWKWNSWPRIGLAQSGRWWKQLDKWGPPYDLNHWNSVDRRGNLVLLSFRHLDAIYAIDRRTGKIEWKLGGTRTPESLKVIGDPRSPHSLGGQHDARFLSRSVITAFDNATFLENEQPRAVKFRIGRSTKTATLLQQVVDSRAKASIAFGSANQSPDGSWLVGWGAIGKDGMIGNYGKSGEAIARLYTPGGVSYRANPVAGPTPTIARLRAAMDQMAARPRKPAGSANYGKPDS